MQCSTVQHSFVHRYFIYSYVVYIKVYIFVVGFKLTQHRKPFLILLCSTVQYSIVLYINTLFTVMFLLQKYLYFLVGFKLTQHRKPFLILLCSTVQYSIVLYINTNTSVYKNTLNLWNIHFRV